MTDTISPVLTLWISLYGGWNWTQTRGQMTKVVFEGPNADAIAADWYARRGGVRRDEDGNVTSWGLCIDETWGLGDDDHGIDPAVFPLTYAALNPTCEHGMSAQLCSGPNHFGEAHDEWAN